MTATATRPRRVTNAQILRTLQELTLHYTANPHPQDPDQRINSLPSIVRPEDAVRLLAPDMETLVQEQLRTLVLDNRNRVRLQAVIYQGNVRSSIIRPAEVLRPAVIENAPNIIIAHNHPSGDPTPSAEDVTITRDLIAAARLMGIDLLDHLVIGHGCHVSMNEKRLGFD